MIYNFNLGIGWASSGVEYAQLYRAKLFREIGADAKFVFTEMFPQENLQHMTENIGFKDSEVLWLYTFFTDTKIAPCSVTLTDLEKTFATRDFRFSRDAKTCRYTFSDGNFYTVYMKDETSDILHRVEIVSKGKLIRKDYYTYCKIYSEYYAPLNDKAHLYGRRFFNEDGSLAYEEINDDEKVMYRLPGQVICSKEELVGYMVERLNLTSDDIVIIDRNTDIGQAIVEKVKPARLGMVIHADHFSESGTNEDHILWNNYYEYAFHVAHKVDFFITATDAQRELLIEQFRKYKSMTPVVYTIPVGSLEELKRPTGSRKHHSFITASRLATEKHIDWLISVMANVHETYPDVTLDIYGKGGEEEKLREQIKKVEAESYVRLMGQYDMTEVYKDYEVYLAGSTSEGFGLTLMEAVGSGLPIIGFDVRYGNPTFIDDGKNGYLIPYEKYEDAKKQIEVLTEAVLKILELPNLDSFHEHSYQVAEKYLTENVKERWRNLVWPESESDSREA